MLRHFSLRQKKQKQTASDILVLCNGCANNDTLEKVCHFLRSALGELQKEKSKSGSIQRKRKPSHQKSSIQRRYYYTQKAKIDRETSGKAIS